MKIVSVYVNSRDVAPSGYYRVTQYLRDYKGLVTVHALLPKKVYVRYHSCSRTLKKILSPLIYIIIYIRTLCALLRDSFTLYNDYVIISKYVLPHYLLFPHTILLKFLAKRNKLIWDFDDNILASNSISKKEFMLLARYSHVIIVISDFLKATIPSEYQDKVVLMPTTDGDMLERDMSTMLQHRKTEFEKQIVLVWVATGGNLMYLERVIPYLEQCAINLHDRNNKKMVLRVICNKPLEIQTSYLVIENIKWTREVAQEGMASAHIGIMPLIDNELTRGKGGFKLVQYMSVGLPIVASAVGYNNNIVNESCGFLVSTEEQSGWQLAIDSIIESWDKYVAYAHNARKRYDESYSYNIVKNFWDSIIK